MIEEFMAITGINNIDEAKQYLESSNQNLNLAVELYLTMTNEIAVESMVPLPPVELADGDAYDDDNNGSFKSFQDNQREALNDFVALDEQNFLPYDHNNLQTGLGTDSAVKDNNDISSEFIRRPDPIKRQRIVDVYQDAYIGTSHRSIHKPLRSVFNSGEEFNAINQKEKNLSQLFRPPYEIMSNGDFEQAKTLALMQGKWLMVNLQDETDFQCHTLNRDFWNVEDVQVLIKCSFVFWQQLSTSLEGAKFVDRYKINQYPSVLIINPFTGATAWRREGSQVSPAHLTDRLQDFLSNHMYPDNPAKRLRTERKDEVHSSTVNLQQEVITIDDDESELARAIAMSLQQPHSTQQPLSCSSIPPAFPSTEANESDEQLGRQRGFQAALVLKSLYNVDKEASSSVALDRSSGKKIQLRFRLPTLSRPISSISSTSTLGISSSRSEIRSYSITSPLMNLVEDIARLIDEQDHSRWFDIYFHHPPRALSEQVVNVINGSDSIVTKSSTYDMMTMIRQIKLLDVGLVENSAITIQFIDT